ncbi:MAG: hypothetical protein A2Y12_01195 [Planctomycetes bacterium GWF2_42_9]|nr:MAG: hypothetical protein A2Y12_01195 [Planctomycetes bacterium GWF2_42_9]
MQQLLDVKECAARLHISRTTFFSIVGELELQGLRRVFVAGAKGHLFLESSLDQLILEAAKNETIIGAKKTKVA